MLSLRGQFFSAGTACVGKLLAQAQCAYIISLFGEFLKRMLSLRRQIFYAGSACVDIFFSAGLACVGELLAQAQCA